MLSAETVVQAAPNQIFSEIANESVILDLDKGLYYGLNEVGTQIWKLVQSSRSIESIIQVLLEEYDVSRETCTESIFALIQDLQSHGLIEVKHETAA